MGIDTPKNPEIETVKQDVFGTIVGYLAQYTQITDFRTGSVAFKLASAIALGIQTALESFETIIEQNDITRAAGADLLHVAQRLFPMRPDLAELQEGDTATGGAVVFRRATSSGDMLIAAGTVVKDASGKLKYLTNVDVVIPDGQVSSVPVDVTAESPGSKYNIAPHTLQKVQGLEQQLTVDNLTSISGGRDPEKDDDLRMRVLSEYKRRIQPGNEEAIKSAAYECGIESVYIDRLSAEDHLTVYVYWQGLENIVPVVKRITLATVLPGDGMINPVFQLPYYPIAFSQVPAFYFGNTPSDIDNNSRVYGASYDPLRGLVYLPRAFIVPETFDHSKHITAVYAVYPDDRFRLFADAIKDMVPLGGLAVYIMAANVEKLASVRLSVSTHGSLPESTIVALQNAIYGQIRNLMVGDPITENTVFSIVNDIDPTLLLDDVTFILANGQQRKRVYPSPYTKLTIENINDIHISALGG